MPFLKPASLLLIHFSSLPNLLWFFFPSAEVIVHALICDGHESEEEAGQARRGGRLRVFTAPFVRR